MADLFAAACGKIADRGLKEEIWSPLSRPKATTIPWREAMTNGWTRRLGARKLGLMRPVDIQAIGSELAIKWQDGSESFIPLEKLRRACPCASCQGEVDILGQLHKGPALAMSPSAFELVGIMPVGGYAIQPTWKDGHNSGLYSFDYLKRVAEASG